jgi:hypothetical protein
MLLFVDKAKLARMDLSDKLSFILPSTFVCCLFYRMHMCSSNLDARWYLFGNSCITCMPTEVSFRSNHLMQCLRGSPQEILRYLQRYTRSPAVSKWQYLRPAYTTSKLPVAPWAGMDTALLQALEVCMQISFQVQRQRPKLKFFVGGGPERMFV